jgi:hypothetical protein
MTETRTPVKPTGQNGSIDRRERRREKLLIEMQRTRLRFEKSDKAAQRLLRKIVEQERQLRRLDKAIARAKAEAADDLVETAVPLAKLGETEIGKANAESWNAIPAVAKAQAKAPAPELRMDDPNHPDLVAARELLSGVNATLDDGIPSPLRRQPREFDPYKGERDAGAKEKAKAKREANKQRDAAEATGERQKMPLTGKAALAAIRGKRKRVSTLADAESK